MSPAVDVPFVRWGDTLRDVIEVIDRHGKGIALVVDEQARLLGVLTDGDVRRLLIRGGTLEISAGELVGRKNAQSQPPMTASVTAGVAAWRALLQQGGVRQLPLLDDHDRVVGLVTADQLSPGQSAGVQAIVMAGGLGTRLRPLTEETPKPMLPIGGRPLMEHVVGQLREAGIRQIHVSTHYCADKIVEFFGDGRNHGVDVAYLHEEVALGTAGALGLLPRPSTRVVVINGDILTNVNFRALVDFHEDENADMTIGVKQYDVQVPFGVVECDGHEVRKVKEKPISEFLINAGLYVIEPCAYDHIVAGERLDMVHLIQALIERGRRVVAFPIREYWMDVGSPDDYDRARNGDPALEKILKRR